MTKPPFNGTISMAWRPNLSAISDLSCWLSISPLSPPTIPSWRPSSFADGVAARALPPSTVRSDLPLRWIPVKMKRYLYAQAPAGQKHLHLTAMSFWSICSSVGGWSPGTFSVGRGLLSQF